jgi:nicotinate-nucleotide adenylyltransferase
MRIGLLGGSFNPAHAGHRHVAELARRRLRLDQVWLLVSPGNPLKPRAGMAPFADRLAGAQAIADGRRVLASGIESAWQTRYTVDTIRLLLRRFPNARFVWIMGADILLQLPAWRRWHDLVRHLAFAVLPRPGYNHRALAGQAVRRLRSLRRPARESCMLPGRAPGWVFLPAPQNATSATAIRLSTKGTPAIAKPPKPPPSPARHKPVARKRAARLALPEAGSSPGSPRKKTIAAGPKKTAVPRKPKAEPSRLDQLQAVIVGSLEDDKAENVVTLDLTGKAMFCDRMVIASGLADRQISAMAQHLQEKLHEAGLKRVPVEGAGGSDWVLIDAGDIVVHLFKPEARTMYGLEKMWGQDLDEAV